MLKNTLKFLRTGNFEVIRAISYLIKPLCRFCTRPQEADEICHNSVPFPQQPTEQKRQAEFEITVKFAQKQCRRR